MRCDLASMLISNEKNSTQTNRRQQNMQCSLIRDTSKKRVLRRDQPLSVHNNH